MMVNLPSSGRSHLARLVAAVRLYVQRNAGT